MNQNLRVACGRQADFSSVGDIEAGLPEQRRR
jgi:hypothetical protein